MAKIDDMNIPWIFDKLKQDADSCHSWFPYNRSSLNSEKLFGEAIHGIGSAEETLTYRAYLQHQRIRKFHCGQMKVNVTQCLSSFDDHDGILERVVICFSAYVLMKKRTIHRSRSVVHGSYLVHASMHMSLQTP